MLAPADFSALRWMSLWKGLRAANHPRAVLLSFSSVMVPPWIGMGLVVAFISGVQPNSPTVPELAFVIWVVFSLAHDRRIVQTCRAQLEGRLRNLASEATG